MIELPRKRGRRQRKRITARTKGEAETLARAYNEAEDKRRATGDRTTVGELLDQWLPVVRRTIESRTYASYDSVARLYLRPQLGDIALSDLTHSDIEEALSTWTTQRRRDKRKGSLSPTTVRYILRTLRTVLTFGIERKLLAENPAKIVKPPKATESEKHPLEADEVRSLLSAAKKSSLYLPVLVALYSGIRRGELLALKWDDIDFEERTLTVRRALEVDRLDGNSVKEKPPKSRSSRRTIPLPVSVVSAGVKLTHPAG